MKDVALPLRTGYVQALSGLTVAGRPVPVYDYMAPYPEAVPYIIISEILGVGDGTKSSFGQEVTIDLLVYTSYFGDFGGRKGAEQIIEQVLGRIMPAPGQCGVSAAGFNVVTAKLLGSADELTRHDTKNTYAKRVTIEHKVFQL